MVLSIKSEKADMLARELASLTGETITDAVLASLEARLEFERRQRRTLGIGDVVERFGHLAVLDQGAPEDIIGYDKHGLPI